jgi:benzoate membrane transport protein
MHSLRRDFSLSAVVAGFVAVLVGYTSSVALIFQAAQAVGASPAHTVSWLWALGLSMGVHWGWAVPMWTVPVFSLSATVGLAVPFFVVTMASQNLPGVAAQRASGYATPVSPPVAVTGLASLLLAPFGGYAFNLAAITAAICMGREAHEDPARRYVAAIMAGTFYIGLGLAAGAVVGLLAAFPPGLVLAVAGLALLSTVTGGLTQAMKDESQRDAAMLTFIVTLSGVSFAGIGSAFWGVLAGVLAMAVQHWRPIR